jgi:acyl-coenzyme A thioesterase PaaI-like protein
MSKVVAEFGVKALTVELRVRFRQHVASGEMIGVRGWIDSQSKRMIKTEAVLTSSDGTELAHAWAIFLVLKHSLSATQM